MRSGWRGGCGVGWVWLEEEAHAEAQRCEEGRDVAKSGAGAEGSLWWKQRETDAGPDRGWERMGHRIGLNKEPAARY
jgi:hypothetical protein